MELFAPVTAVYLLGVASTILLARILLGDRGDGTGCFLDFVLVILGVLIALAVSFRLAVGG